MNTTKTPIVVATSNTQIANINISKTNPVKAHVNSVKINEDGKSV